MTTFAISRHKFDIVEYIKKLRNAGVSQEIAEIQAQELDHALQSIKEEIDHTEKELATKKDMVIIKAEIKETELRLQKEIRELEVRLMTRLMTMYGAGFLILLGILAKGFHWL